jgi:catechol 2,3-dioxygenase-like lactoylglutathione lyase family enzyme
VRRPASPRSGPCSPAVLRVTGFDHLVLIAADVERSLALYVDELGCEPVRVDEWRRGEVFFPSFRLSAETIVDVVPGDRGEGRGNVDHFCLVVEPTDLEALAASGRFDVVAGPDRRYGARGDGTSVYLRDPDGNVLELRHYGGA